MTAFKPLTRGELAEYEARARFVPSLPASEWEPMLRTALHYLARCEQLERERDEETARADCHLRDLRQRTDAAFEFKDRAEAAEAREKQLRDALARAAFLAQHLWQMIPPEVWRDHGADDGQGHYEGDYHAEKVRDELAALASVSAEEPSEEREQA